MPLLKELYYEIVEEIDKQFERLGLSPEILKTIAADHGLSHIAYLAVNVPTLTEDRPYGAHTYDPEWEIRYVSEKYIQIDPVVRYGLSGLLPLDWRSVRNENKRVARFFAEAGEFGVGLQGLSFPIRGIHGETALFSLNAHSSDAEWSALKRQSMRDFQILAYHFHTLVLEKEGIVFRDVSLTPRETECLKWAAGGKTAWETCMILGISEKTVDFFIEQARVKLYAINKVQAVAKAIRLNLI